MKNKIIQNNLISCLVAVILTAVVCLMTYSSFMASTMNVQAENQAYVIREICESYEGDPADALEEIKDSFKNRVTLIATDGSVLFDSVHDEQTLENHLERQEIVEALANGKGSGKRYSDTDKTNNYYFAVKAGDIGIIRVGVKSNAFLTDEILVNLPVIVLAIAAILIMVYAVSVKTTQNIVSTIENYDFDNEDSITFRKCKPL